jgi:hypothetical protein
MVEQKGEVLIKKLSVDLVAQLVEHNTFNVGALGSSPSGITVVARRGRSPRRFSFDGARWDEKFIPSLELSAVLLN